MQSGHREERSDVAISKSPDTFCQRRYLLASFTVMRIGVFLHNLAQR